QTRVARAEAALARAQRALQDTLIRLAGLAVDPDVRAQLPAHIVAAMERTPAEEAPDRNLRQRIITAMEAQPTEVFTPTRLAPLVATTKRDSIRNALLALAGSGKIQKISDGNYQALTRSGETS